MLPGDLCNPAQMGTVTTPDSTYEWRNFGEHVRADIVAKNYEMAPPPAKRGPYKGGPSKKRDVNSN